MEDLKGNIRVIVRCRPSLKPEEENKERDV
jgi:hypothetical protein